MFYRRKYYIVKNDFVEAFNETNLPNQLKHGARLTGRWMTSHDATTTEIFAIWEYDSYEKYQEIEANVRGDQEHVQRVQNWYEKHGGRTKVFEEYCLEVRNDELISTLK
ncbi:NIPSNAP family protein [Bacillus sp. AFS017336]|uniref:NIPSNAP family protein n=1 Tax=Bacillus sp. AFS017336 TaxID=2033489 RepID=UPI000BEF2E72|nr:NIPSNAP family protein [Bacillus sp. AFS017336]PEK98891.1 cytoplasmic protein [Bacillus sp. AFS017336]